MHRRITNTTRYHPNARKLNWRVEWVFASANIRLVDAHIAEDTTLSEVGATSCTYVHWSQHLCMCM